jgi:hypothetical protein
MRGMEMLFELFVATMAVNFKNSCFETFYRDLGLEHQFSSPYVGCQNGVFERKIVPFVRWLERCSRSIGL